MTKPASLFVGWVRARGNLYKTDITYKPYFFQTLLRKTYNFPRSWTNLQTLFSKKTLRRFFKKSWNFFTNLYIYKPHILVYNIFMTRNHFSKKGGPYFVADIFYQPPRKPSNKVSTIARIKSFFKSRFKSRPSDQK